MITLLWLSACSTSSYAPVNERSQPSSTALSGHRVSVGETLFSIAWRYGLDYKSLARRNHINSHYTIYPGQVLDLNVDKKSPWQPQSSSNRKSKTSASTPLVIVKSAPSRSEKHTTSAKKTSSNLGLSSKFSWQWPASGKLVKKYSQNTPVNKGIDISGKKGESVITAAPGRVVYSGSGLRGYGKLVIIKHNSVFLSAYAHNSRLWVKEGQVVKAGEKIADIGSSGTDRNLLHFEIRRNGHPVDPVKYLPRR